MRNDDGRVESRESGNKPPVHADAGGLVDKIPLVAHDAGEHIGDRILQSVVASCGVEPYLGAVLWGGDVDADDVTPGRFLPV